MKLDSLDMFMILAGLFMVVCFEKFRPGSFAPLCALCVEAGFFFGRAVKR